MRHLEHARPPAHEAAHEAGDGGARRLVKMGPNLIEHKVARAHRKNAC